MAKVPAKERAYVQALEFPEPVVPWGKAEPNLRWLASDWKPTFPPSLLHGEKVGLDFEYDPDDRDMTKSKAIGFSVWSKDRREGWYVPWGHAGGNLPEETCRRWFANEMKDRDVYGLNTKAEMHMVRNWDMDPRRMKLRPHDVAFAAALLNENRYDGFSLESLAEEYLPAGERKIHPAEVPPQYFKLAHSGFVKDRGISDSMLAMRIHEETQGKILAEALDRVLDVEDRGILAVTEMERNGAIIDLPKLERWIAECENRIERLTSSLGKKSGRPRFSPDAGGDMEALFRATNTPKPSIFDEKQKAWVNSWAAEGLENLAFPGGKRFDKERNLNQVLHEDAAMALEIRHYKSMLSKYFYKFRAAMDNQNTIHYLLHQMRSTSEFGIGEDEKFGTVTGRFSCGGGKYAINIQQMMKCESQIEDWGTEFIIRELFLPGLGMKMGASDASQIEFRLFGHYSGAKLVVQEYGRDPWVDFHMMVTMLMNPTVVDPKLLKFLRVHMKHNNFGVLYGMGRPKLARRLGLPCTCPCDWYEKTFDPRRNREVNVRYFKDNSYHETDCKARQANDIMDEYNAKFPEAHEMLEKASNRAKEKGFVHTLLGRRRRFPDGQMLHKALNAVIQGSAADYFKLKMIELYEVCESLGIKMRMPVHDEFVYDIEPDRIVQRANHKGKIVDYAAGVEELLQTQSLDLKVPLLWESGYGNNWREANGQ